MVDVISRILFLMLIMSAFIVLWYIFDKLNGVDLKKMQDKVDDIHTVVFTPIDDNEEEKERRERCLICCDGCEKKETCAGNNGCDVCKKNKE